MTEFVKKMNERLISKSPSRDQFLKKMNDMFRQHEARRRFIKRYVKHKMKNRKIQNRKQWEEVYENAVKTIIEAETETAKNQRLGIED
jgi:endonuclease V-like protein UPF0215 family